MAQREMASLETELCNAGMMLSLAFTTFALTTEVPLAQTVEIASTGS